MLVRLKVSPLSANGRAVGSMAVENPAHRESQTEPAPACPRLCCRAEETLGKLQAGQLAKISSPGYYRSPKIPPLGLILAGVGLEGGSAGLCSFVRATVASFRGLPRKAHSALPMARSQVRL